ncbi:relaxase MobL [Enterococcus sp. LJL120]
MHGEWTGAIHYNTDNIHVHIGYTERTSSRPLIEVVNEENPSFYNLERKGKFLKKNIRATRAKFINELLTMDDMLMQTSEQFNKMIENAKGYSENFVTDQYATLFQNLYEAMLENRRFWKYGYAKGQKFQYQVDAITNLYLNTEQSAEVEKLRQYLAPISKEYEAAYGNPKNQPTYEDNKLYGKDGLYHKIGNVVLSKLSEYDKTIRSQNRTKGARLSDFDLESLAIEESIVPSDLPPLDDIYLPGDEPIAKQDIDDYENLYFDSLSQSISIFILEVRRKS